MPHSEPPPRLLSWWQPYKYAASNVQQVREAEFTPGTRHTHTPPSLLSPCDWQKWCEKLQVSLMCLFLSISVTGRPGLPFVHRRGEAGHAGSDQIHPRKSGSDPAPFGFTTHPSQSHHPGLRHWGRSLPPQEAEDDKEFEIKNVQKWSWAWKVPSDLFIDTK